jgi:hypothetical protein
MDRPRRDSRQHNGITLRGPSQPTFATKSALSRNIFDLEAEATKEIVECLFKGNPRAINEHTARRASWSTPRTAAEISNMFG